MLYSQNSQVSRRVLAAPDVLIHMDARCVLHKVLSEDRLSVDISIKIARMIQLEFEMLTNIIWPVPEREKERGGEKGRVRPLHMKLDNWSLRCSGHRTLHNFNSRRLPTADLNYDACTRIYKMPAENFRAIYFRFRIGRRWEQNCTVCGGAFTEYQMSNKDRTKAIQLPSQNAYGCLRMTLSIGGVHQLLYETI